VSTTTQRPWQVLEQAACTICESETEVAVATVELAEGVRSSACCSRRGRVRRSPGAAAGGDINPPQPQEGRWGFLGFDVCGDG
jgi:hypothetical protein